jgi:hypothetical protein
VLSNTVRWRLILGCLVLGAILAPESALVLVQDLQGPWRGDASARASALASDAQALKPRRAEASVVHEELLARARRATLRSDTRPVAVLVAR